MTYEILDDLVSVYDSCDEPYTVDPAGHEQHFLVKHPLKWPVQLRLDLDHGIPYLFLLWYYDNEKKLSSVEFAYGPGETALTFVHGFETDRTLEQGLVYWLAGLQ